VSDEFITDEFGTFLRGHAPIRNRAGQVVGAVVVEAPSEWVQAKMNPIRLSALAALLLAALLAVPAALFTGRRLGADAGHHEMTREERAADRA
jgi:sensor histidine kinase regulating citrate/malate metabolism